jgi:hypothetical protein
VPAFVLGAGVIKKKDVISRAEERHHKLNKKRSPTENEKSLRTEKRRAMNSP